MNGVAERIEYGGDVKIDSVTVLPDVRHREHDAFRKRSGAVYADALGVSTKVAPSGHAVAAPAAHHVTIAADQFSDPEVGYIRAARDDLAYKFVTDDHRDPNGGFGPVIPFVDMKVGAANSGPKNADFDVIDAKLRFGNLFEPKAATRLTFYQRFHFDFPLVRLTRREL